jgi:predicted TIM-barrel fold metal-dependent hydrolase
MRFLDANCRIGLPAGGAPPGGHDVASLLTSMDRAGIERALVWHVAQREYAVPEGNRLLAQAIAAHRDRLSGCWALLPPQCPELPPLPEFLAQMAAAGVHALRAFPAHQNWLLRREVMGDELDAFAAAGVPLLFSPGDVGGWSALYDLLAAWPALTVVICDVGMWGPDRLVRPLVQRYPNVYLELSQYIVADGIRAFVEACGAQRLLYGSGYPDWEHGSMMLALRHAEISASAKAAIAAGNLERLLAWHAR